MPKQITSRELTDDLLAFIERKFYPGDAVNFNKDKKRLLAWVILWPATYLDAAGVTLTPERYQQIFMETVILALQQGDTGNIKYRPAWLMRVIQSHYKIHWEEIYAEAKSARSATEDALRIASRMPIAIAADPIQEMALANRLLKGTGRTKKPVLKQALNLELKF